MRSIVKLAACAILGAGALRCLEGAADPAIMRGLWRSDGGSVIRIEAEASGTHVGRLVRVSSDASAAGFAEGDRIISVVQPGNQDEEFRLVMLVRPQQAQADQLTVTHEMVFAGGLLEDGTTFYGSRESGLFRVIVQDGKMARQAFVDAAGSAASLVLTRTDESALATDESALPPSWPRIQGVVLLDDVLLRDATVANPGVLDDPLELHDRDVVLLFVYGQGLVGRGEAVSTDAAVLYETLAESADGRLPDHMVTPAHGARLAQTWRLAWDQVAARVGPGFVRRDFHGLLLKARLEPGAVPGAKDLCLGPATGSWPLTRGSVRAAAEFLRTVTIEEGINQRHYSDPVGTVFLQDRLVDPIFLEVTALDPVAPSVTEIPVLVGLADDAGNDSGLARSWVVAARRSGSAEPTFHTAVIQVSNAAYDAAKPGSGARPGQSLIAVVGADGSLFSNVALAQARIQAVPRKRPADETDPAAILEGPCPLWRGAVLDAAQAADKMPVDVGVMTARQWDDLADAEAWQRTGWLMPSGVTVKIGHHAAMLLLQRTFISALETELARLDTVLSDDTSLQAFVDFLRPVMRQPDHPLAKVEVMHPADAGTEDPRMLPLARFFDRQFLASVAAEMDTSVLDPTTSGGAAVQYHFELAQLGNRILRDRVKAAARVYQQQINGALAIARGTTAPDELLRLTGQGFEPVEQMVRSQLIAYRLHRAGEAAVVGDSTARAYLQDLGRLARRLSFEETRSREFIQFSMAFISLASLPIAAVGGTGTLLVDGGLMAFNAVDLAYGVYDHVSQQAREYRTIQLARGAASVLGTDYLNRINFQETPAWANAVMVACSALGMHGLKGDMFELLGRVNLRQAHRRAAALLGSFEADGLEGMRRWPLEDQKLFLAALSDAVSRNARHATAGVDNLPRLLAAADDVTALARRLRATREVRLHQTCTSTSLCFAAGTPVWTPDGPEPIETVVPGSLVWSRDPQGSEEDFRRVRRVLASEPAEFCVIDYRPGGLEPAPAGGPDSAVRRIITTPEHPFRVDTERAFVPARELRAGQRLACANDGTAEVLAVDVVPASSLGSPRAYNLEVEDFSTYFVGADALWVHNSGLTCQEGVTLFARLLERGYSATEAYRILRRQGLSAGAQERLADAVSELAEFQEAQAAIDHLRTTSGAGPYLGANRTGGTVARIQPRHDGVPFDQPILGFNSTLMAVEDYQALARRYLVEMQQRLGRFAGSKVGDQDLQWLLHAEAHALMQAHDKLGRWARRIVVVIDRPTCGYACMQRHTGLINLVELMGFEEVVIISRNGTRVTFRPAGNPRVSTTPDNENLIRFAVP